MSEGGGRSDPVVDVAPLTATMSQLSTSGSNNSQAFGGLVTHFAKGEETSSTDAHFQVPLPFTVTGTQHGLSKFNNNTHNKFQRQRSKSLTHQQYHHQGSSQQKTTMHHLQDGSTPPHKPSGSSGSSGSYVAKPSPSAFHSTGVLSKKGRGGGLYGLGGGGNGSEGSKITPETPIKHKRVLGSIWSGLDGPTNAASMLKPGPISGGSSKSVHYGSGGGGIDCQPPQDTPLKRSTPASLLPPYLSNNSHRNTPHLHPTSTSTSSFSALGKPPQIPGSFSSSKFLVSPVDLRINKIEATTPSVASAASTKSSRLHRSPLKETPTKLFKRPHLEQNEKDGKYSLDLHSQNQQHGISQENMHPFLFSNDRNITIDETANLPAQQSTSIQNVSGMDIVIDEEGEAPLESSGGLPSSLQNPMQPPSTIEQQQQDLNPSSISAATQPSPVIPAKLFFSRIVKERKNVPAPSLAPSIPFTALISRYRHSIDQVFFDAADGVQPGLNLTLSMFARRGGSGIDSLAIPDWFESRFELIGRLGQGEFADAFHVLSLDDGIEYAIKKTRHPFIGYKDAYVLSWQCACSHFLSLYRCRIQKLNEVRMLLQVKASPYCVSLKDAWIQFGYIYIQTEICKRGRYVTIHLHVYFHKSLY